MFLDVSQTQKDTEFFPTLEGHKRLLEPYYRHAWKNFREQICLSDVDFDQYYTATLTSFADYVQNLPASRYVFYGHAGGFLQLGFERAMIATQLAIKSFYDFEGLSFDQLDVLAQAEIFAVFTAALLSDLNFLPKRFQVRVKNSLGHIKDYDAYSGSLLQQGKFYQYDFFNPELPGWGAPASLTLAHTLLAQTQKNYYDSAFAWISQHYNVLQVWYAMILGLTPGDETSTRQRYLIGLIPEVENDLVSNLLLSIHQQDWLATKQTNPSLFGPSNQDENIISQGLANEQDPLGKNLNEFDRPGATEGANAQLLRALGSRLSPHVRHGLAFIAWLLNAAGKEQSIDPSDAPKVFRLGETAVFDIQKCLKEFAAHGGQSNPYARNKAIISSQELVKALREAQILKAQHISLLHYSWDTMKGKHQFEGLALPLSLLPGKMPPITLGLSVNTKPIAPSSNATAAPLSSMFQQNKSTM